MAHDRRTSAGCTACYQRPESWLGSVSDRDLGTFGRQVKWPYEEMIRMIYPFRRLAR
ncbi:hypothetical protein DESC_180094 [Desulfosarcina cetonica]|nr:hypothetical protein DESC_180094 [Desulfosarcina cetonica]